jgi:hypothetical protein
MFLTAILTDLPKILSYLVAELLPKLTHNVYID